MTHYRDYLEPEPEYVERCTEAIDHVGQKYAVSTFVFSVVIMMLVVSERTLDQLPGLSTPPNVESAKFLIPDLKSASVRWSMSTNPAGKSVCTI